MALYKIIGVPRIKQDTAFSCWYASARMVLACFEIGPRIGIPDAYEDSTNAGLSNARFGELAKAEGLRFLSDLADLYFDETDTNAAKRLGLGLNAKTKGFTFQDLAKILNLFGPIWTMVERRHIVVVTGATDEGGSANVLYNDPADGSSKTKRLDDFNTMIAWEDGASMMCYPPVMYPNTRTPKRARFISAVSVQRDVFTA
jgi:ABC-type bacteriocin/lantibiotic exporter with double-glycine peptidase domain